MSKRYLVIISCIATTLLLSMISLQEIVQAQSKQRSPQERARKAAKATKLAKKEHIERESEEFEEEELEKLDLARERARQLYRQRAYPLGYIPVEGHSKAVAQTKNLRKRMAEDISPLAVDSVKPIGPMPILNGQTFGARQNVTGRVTSLALDPQDPNIVYLGAAGGGLWKSTNAGQSWTPLSDTAPTQTTGSIAVDAKDSNTIFIGTGEGNFSGDCLFGLGLLKTTDGGQTWTNLAQSTFQGRAINRVLLDPNSSNIVYVASGLAFAGVGFDIAPTLPTSGIYKSTDGGVTFTLIFQVNGVTAFDVVMDPTNSSTLYASFNGQGIFKSTNGGANWTKLGGGLPSSGFSRASIAISRSNPSTLYAAYGNGSTDDLLNIFQSTNGGTSWTAVTKPPVSGFGNICQCSYDNFMAVNPTNPSIVYFGGVSLYRSNNGGQSWTDIGRTIHADLHAMAIAPGNPNLIYVGNDGGIWTSTDGGNTMTNINTNLNITQFQSVALHPTDPNITIGGTQDNGTELYTGNIQWQHSDDGDGGFTGIDQMSPTTFYDTRFNLAGVIIGPNRSDAGGTLGSWRSIRTGINQNDDVLFYAPFALDPTKASTLYFGTNRLYRTATKGDSWLAISQPLTKNPGDGNAISAIAVAPSTGTIYTGASDGAVFTSLDNGASFQNVTDNLPARYISDIVTDPSTATTIYASLGGFQAGHVFKSTQGGGKWQNITANLPDSPANALVINPSDPKNLFVGMDVGLFQTTDGGTTWKPVLGIPIVPVFDIAVNGTTGVIRIATHGRGMYEGKLGGNGPVADFTLTVSPTGQSVQPGGSTSFNINTQAIAGFAQPINLAVASTNPTVQATLTNSSVMAGFPVTLNVTTTPLTPTGVVTLTITATSGQLVKTQLVTVSVQANANKPPTIATIADITVNAGEQKSLSVSANDPDGNAGLKLSLTTNLSFVSLTDNGNGSGLLSITPSSTDSQGGTVTVVVTDAGGLAAQTTFNVTVQQPLTVTSAVFKKPILTISGVGFGPSGAKVQINSTNVSSNITQQSDTQIILQGNKKKLKIVKGTNQLILTTSDGRTVTTLFKF